MKQSVILLVLVSILTLVGGNTLAETSVTLDNVVQVPGLNTGGTILAGLPATFEFRFTYTPGTGDSLTSIVSGYQIFTSLSDANPFVAGYFDATEYDSLSISGGWFYHALFEPLGHFDGVFFGNFSVDGEGRDTIKMAFTNTGTAPGLQDGFSEPAVEIETTPWVVGDTLCIDSSWWPPGGAWTWGTTSGDIQPDWAGPFCFEVASCCVGNQGNINLVGDVDVSDLTELVDYLFPPHDSLLCSATAGNVDGLSSGGVPINVSDVTYLVAYLFMDGPPPALCAD